MTLAQYIQTLELEEQRLAVRNYSRCVVLARPGSGKTYTLVLKAAYLLGQVIKAPQKIACITYMNDAVGEIYDRLEKLGIEDDNRLFVGTVHSFCFGAVIQPFKSIFLKDLPTPLIIADEKTQTLCWQEANVNNKDEKSRLQSIRRAQVLGNYTSAPEHDKKRLNAYRDALIKRGMIDFDGIAHNAYMLVRDHSIVRNYVVSCFPWLLIDEYQDLGEVFNALIREIIDHTNVNFFIVGDPNQSIMGFQGANPSYLSSLIRKPSVETVKLTITRRCLPHIISIANRLSDDFIEPHASFPISEREANCVFCPGGFNEQIMHIVEIITAEIKLGVLLGQIAILCRTNPTINSLTSQLYKHNIPFAGSRDSRYERTPFIRFLEDMAAWIFKDWNDRKPKFERIYRQYKVYVNKSGLQLPFDSALDMQERFFNVLLHTSKAQLTARDWLDYLSSSDGLYLDQIAAKFKSNELYLATSFDTFKREISENGRLHYMTVADLALCGKSANSVFVSTLHWSTPSFLE